VVDFNRLLEDLRSQSPEQRRASRDEMEARLEAHTQAQIAQRTAQIVRALGVPCLEGKERRFIEDLKRMAERSDRLLGLMGGELLGLTDNQLGWLDRIAARAEVATETLAPKESLSRAQRFRGA
jgi:hypothetical protein